ncbi:hypothetical protein [Segnochrobactrum spirostomi]|uniref:Uncharacterized protein n=1 Tax=Segnochrobactrum spirostomi TaxID=2608987 RepID=A0A6A7Y689_9HYPH|nr:hypothetical protein [Segnochrobactrum spirostomi]MQT13601.1 hypothetical protein [Segnochrobactrum spirostomi]
MNTNRTTTALDDRTLCAVNGGSWEFPPMQAFQGETDGGVGGIAGTVTLPPMAPGPVISVNGRPASSFTGDFQPVPVVTA